MNPRPPGYEPGELPDCSTPRRGRRVYHRRSLRSTACSGSRSPSAWSPCVGSIGYAATRAWRLWKTRSRRAADATDAVGRVHGVGCDGGGARRLADGGTERLSDAVTRLQRSLEELARDPRCGRRAARPARVDPRPRAAQVTRVAAIDLGTNATRLLVADVSDGELTEVVRRTRITRLGEGVDARRRLLPVPIARVRNALTDFRREARGARRRASARGRDERGARRRERRGVPRRDRMVVRVRDAPSHRRRGGGDDAAAASARSSPGRSSSTSAAARPS